VKDPAADTISRRRWLWGTVVAALLLGLLSLARVVLKGVPLSRFSPSVLADSFVGIFQMSPGSIAGAFVSWFALWSLGCGLVLRFTYRRFAPTFAQVHSYTQSTDRLNQVLAAIFPKRAMAGRTWSYHEPHNDPTALLLSAYPLPKWSELLILLVTLILPGYVALVLMGAVERVTIRTTVENGRSYLWVEACGYTATTKAKELITELDQPETD